MFDWNKQIQVDGETITCEEYLRRVWRKLSDREIADQLTKLSAPANYDTVHNKRRFLGLKKRQGKKQEDTSVLLTTNREIAGVPLENVLAFLKNKPRSLRALSVHFDRSEATIEEVLDALRREHYNIVETAGEHVLDTRTIVPEKRCIPETLADRAGMCVRLALVSDLHAGSLAQQITSFRRFIQDAYDADVRHVLVSGDICAGHEVYRGQIHDLYAVGSALQLIAAVETLPRLDGLTYYVIGGNHDYSFVKSEGFNIVSALGSERDDVEYLGFDLADVPITDQVDIRLWHPSGGVPYAISYRLQKGLEQIAYDELVQAIESGENPKMRVVSAGHLHVATTLWRGPILGLQVGCFEGQTNYLKRKALFPQIGGYVVELWLTDSGLIQRCRQEFKPFLEIRDDHRNYPDLLERLRGAEPVPEREPLFQWISEDDDGPNGAN